MFTVFVVIVKIIIQITCRFSELLYNKAKIAKNFYSIEQSDSTVVVKGYDYDRIKVWV